MLRETVYAMIDDERERQAAKWAAPHPWGEGDSSSPAVDLSTKVMVLTEEVGEVARAVLDLQSDEQLAAELVQVAAVAVAILEGIDL